MKSELFSYFSISSNYNCLKYSCEQLKYTKRLASKQYLLSDIFIIPYSLVRLNFSNET